MHGGDRHQVLAQALHGHGLQCSRYQQSAPCAPPVPVIAHVTPRLVADDGLIQFPEFVFACAVLCTLTKYQILYELFKTFDEDSSGFIEVTEFRALASAIDELGGNAYPGRRQNTNRVMRSPQRAPSLGSNQLACLGQATTPLS